MPVLVLVAFRNIFEELTVVDGGIGPRAMICSAKGHVVRVRVEHGHAYPFAAGDRLDGRRDGRKGFDHVGRRVDGREPAEDDRVRLDPGARRREPRMRDDHADDAGEVAVGLGEIAAFVEAYWSSMREISVVVKYVVGAGLWLLVGAYFLLGGRRV